MPEHQSWHRQEFLITLREINNDVNVNQHTVVAREFRLDEL